MQITFSKQFGVFLGVLILLLGVAGTLWAQVGIGTTNPDASAALDVTSSDKGFLPPASP